MKSYLVLACVAFVVGFVGYWTLGYALAGGGASPAAPAYQAPASADLPKPDFNHGKHV